MAKRFFLIIVILTVLLGFLPMTFVGKDIAFANMGTITCESLLPPKQTCVFGGVTTCCNTGMSCGGADGSRNPYLWCCDKPKKICYVGNTQNCCNATDRCLTPENPEGAGISGLCCPAADTICGIAGSQICCGAGSRCVGGDSDTPCCTTEVDNGGKQCNSDGNLENWTLAPGNGGNTCVHQVFKTETCFGGKWSSTTRCAENGTTINACPDGVVPDGLGYNDGRNTPASASNSADTTFSKKNDFQNFTSFAGAGILGSSVGRFFLAQFADPKQGDVCDCGPAGHRQGIGKLDADLVTCVCPLVEDPCTVVGTGAAGKYNVDFDCIPIGNTGNCVAGATATCPDGTKQTCDNGKWTPECTQQPHTKPLKTTDVIATYNYNKCVEGDNPGVNDECVSLECNKVIGNCKGYDSSRCGSIINPPGSDKSITSFYMHCLPGQDPVKLIERKPGSFIDPSQSYCYPAEVVDKECSSTAGPLRCGVNPLSKQPAIFSSTINYTCQGGTSGTYPSCVSSGTTEGFPLDCGFPETQCIPGPNFDLCVTIGGCKILPGGRNECPVMTTGPCDKCGNHCTAGGTGQCTNGGTRTCKADGTWGECNGACTPNGSAQACTGGGNQTCTNGQWAPCAGSCTINGTTQNCPDGTPQTCTNSQWSTCGSTPPFSTGSKCNKLKKCDVNGTGDSCTSNDDCVNQKFCNDKKQCVEGATGPSCKNIYDCLKLPSCDSSKHCVPGGGGAYCSSDANCATLALGCNADQQCVFGGAFGSCKTFFDCLKKHTCNSAKQCVVDGGGKDCNANSDCTSTVETFCNGNNCNTTGTGFPCNSSADCATCNFDLQKCGAYGGSFWCTADAQCKEPVPTYCSGNSCVINGNGPSCSSDSDCKTCDLENQVCSESIGGSLWCTADAQCTNPILPGTSRCNGNTCSSDGTGWACTSSAQCKTCDPVKEICGTTNGGSWWCGSDGDCKAPVQSHCAGNTCSKTGNGFPCSKAEDCYTCNLVKKTCGVNGGSLWCNNDSDCGGTAKCDSNNVCSKNGTGAYCNSNTDCSTCDMTAQKCGAYGGNIFCYGDDAKCKNDSTGYTCDGNTCKAGNNGGPACSPGSTTDCATCDFNRKKCGSYGEGVWCYGDSTRCDWGAFDLMGCDEKQQCVPGGIYGSCDSWVNCLDKATCSEDKKCVMGGGGKSCPSIDSEGDSFCADDLPLACNSCTQQCVPGGDTGIYCTLDDPYACQGYFPTCGFDNYGNAQCTFDGGGSPCTLVNSEGDAFCASLGTYCNSDQKCVPGGCGPSCGSDADCGDMPTCGFDENYNVVCVPGGGGDYCDPTNSGLDCNYPSGCNGDQQCVPGGDGPSCSPETEEADCNKPTCGVDQSGNAFCEIGGGGDYCETVYDCKLNEPPTVSDLSSDSGEYCSGMDGAGSATFSWQYNDKEGDEQTKWQIQISTSADFNDKNSIIIDVISNGAASTLNIPVTNISTNNCANDVNIHDDGTQENGCSHINYATKYYWQVQVWAGDTSSGWVDYAKSFTYAWSHPAPTVHYSYSNVVVKKPVTFSSHIEDGSQSTCYKDDGTSYICSDLNTNMYKWWLDVDNESPVVKRCSNPSDDLSDVCYATEHTYNENKNYQTKLEICDSVKNGNTTQHLCCSSPEKAISLNSNAQKVPLWQEVSPFK